MPTDAAPTTSRVSDVEGKVAANTLALGDVVINIKTIGTMKIVDGKRKGRWRMLVAAALIPLLLLAMRVGVRPRPLPGWDDETIAIISVLAMAICGLVYSYMMQRVDRTLIIATCDGHRILLTSKDKEGLKHFRSFLRGKIDSNSPEVADIRIGDRIEIISGGGGVVVGERGIASGKGGNAGRSGRIEEAAAR